MTVLEVLCAVAIVIGMVTTVVPVLPGVLLVALAMAVWAMDTGGTAWTYAGIALLALAVGFIVKFAVPHRQLKEAGVPLRTILVGALLGIVGFFVIPVIGLFIGFVAGVWLSESRRLGSKNAWPSTKAALKATGLSILIELGSVLVAAAAFVAGVVAT